MQLGNYKQVIVIQGISILGYILLLFIIYKGKNYLSSQYQEIDIPYNQLFRVSTNRQITNKLSLKQLKHFNRHIKDQTMGVYQLLIINSYKSYQLYNFKNYYKEYKILTLYIPIYLSYILQLLDIGYFLPLKQKYSHIILGLARNSILYINKITFLLVFLNMFNVLIIENNIKGSFQGAGLVLFNLEVVLLNLNAQIHTLTPPITSNLPQQSKTPSNTLKFRL